MAKYSHWVRYEEAVWEKLSESEGFFVTVAMSDMAWIPTIPLMARFVWFIN